MEDKETLNNGDGMNQEEDFASLLAQYEQKSSKRLKPGGVVQGKIVSVFDTEVLVDAGDGRREFLKEKKSQHLMGLCFTVLETPLWSCWRAEQGPIIN